MLSGPSFVPKEPQNALILFHGYGADGEDLFTLTTELKKHFKNMAFFAPNAPTITFGGGYEWFSLDDYFSKPELDIDYLKILETRAIEKLPIVEEYISQIENQLNIKRNHIFIAGFSQGGLIAAQTAFKSNTCFNGLILMSPVPMISIESTAKKTPILLTRGLQDTVIPPQAAQLVKPLLVRNNFSVTESNDSLLGHGISSQHVDALIQFIQKHIKN